MLFSIVKSRDINSYINSLRKMLIYSKYGEGILNI